MGNKSVLKSWWPYALLFYLVLVMFWAEILLTYFGSGAGQGNGATPNIFAELASADSINANIGWWAAAFAFSALIISYLTAKGINSFFNHHSLRSAEDDLLIQIPACTDEEVIEYNATLGISVSHDEVIVPKKILKIVSVEALAHDLGFLLYLSYREIKDHMRLGRYTAMHSLADILLDNWTHERISNFVIALANEKDYLGHMLDAALKRRSLERQVDKLQREIAACCEQEATVTEQLRSTRTLVGRFADYQELLSGKSALAKWLKEKSRRIIRKDKK